MKSSMIDQTRDCGTCRACCIHLEIDDFAKPAGTPCLHLRKRNGTDGCTIYEARPATCRGFTCLWAAGKFDAKSWRPDRCGVLAHVVRNELDGFGINVVECRPGAIARNDKLVKQCQAIPCRLVTIQYLDGRRRMFSRDKTWLKNMRLESEGDPWQLPLNTQWVQIDIDRNDQASMKVMGPD